MKLSYIFRIFLQVFQTFVMYFVRKFNINHSSKNHIFSCMNLIFTFSDRRYNDTISHTYVSQQTLHSQIEDIIIFLTLMFHSKLNKKQKIQLFLGVVHFINGRGDSLEGLPVGLGRFQFPTQCK